MIKEELHKQPPIIVLLWTPSNCAVEDNKKANELARLGMEMKQNNILITQKMVKAKIWTRSGES